MKELALNYLNKNRLINIDMIEGLNRSLSEVVCAGDDGVLLYDSGNELYSLSTDNEPTAVRFLSGIEEYNILICHKEFERDLVTKLYENSEHRTFCQFVYDKTEQLELSGAREIKMLDESYLGVILEHYHTVPDPEYISYLIGEGLMHGAFEQGRLCGFIGMHGEGSMGLLEVFPEFKRRGVAYDLEAFMINFNLKRGFTPYCQVNEDNEPSLNLQTKLGLTRADGYLYWF